MLRTIIRFVTKFPGRPVPTQSVALLVYGLSWQVLLAELGRLRDRLRRSTTFGVGYLINDGSVLAAELVRQLPQCPVGHLSLGAVNPGVEMVINVQTDILDQVAEWQVAVNGQEVPLADCAPEKPCNRRVGAHNGAA